MPDSGCSASSRRPTWGTRPAGLRDTGAIDPDEVWRAIEEARRRLHHRCLQYGDPRCNRTAYGGFAGGRHWSLLDEDDPRDAAALTSFLDAYGRMDFGASRPLLALRLARGALGHPAVVTRMRGVAVRALGRMGAATRSDSPSPAAGDLRDAQLHGCVCRHPRLGGHRARRDQRLPRGARRAGAPCRPAPTRWPTRRPGASCPRARSTPCSTPARTVASRRSFSGAARPTTAFLKGPPRPGKGLGSGVGVTPRSTKEIHVRHPRRATAGIAAVAGAAAWPSGSRPPSREAPAIHPPIG